jgi:small subunit ribosomal protein S6
MRDYEVVYIFDASLDEDAINQKLERFHPLLTGNGGEVTAVDHWGVRQLAYPVRKQGSGYYVVAQFKAEAASLPEFERIIKLDDELLRYLVVLSEGEPSSGMSILVEVDEEVAARRALDDDDDDDEDDDEDEEELVHGASPPEFSGGRGRRRRVDGPAIEVLNYKDVATLSRFVTEQGKLLPKRTTKVAAGFQRRLTRAIKRARYLALLPYVQNHER